MFRQRSRLNELQSPRGPDGHGWLPRRRLVCLLAIVTPVALCAPAFGETQAIRLPAEADSTIEGAAPGDRSGAAVANVGDVNGDRRSDLLIAAPGVDRGGHPDLGAVYVVFAPIDPWLKLAELGQRGYRIDTGGIGAPDSASRRYLVSVAPASDVNGDGLGDVLVGLPYAGTEPRKEAGSAYVVFGKRGSDDVDLAALGEGGFRIDGASAGDHAGYSLAGAGDVNRDGLADLLLGASDGAIRAGRTAVAYVVFGKLDSGAVDLANLGGRGYRIELAASDEPYRMRWGGGSVTGLGDVNGDGRSETVVTFSGRSSGAAVVFGKDGAEPIDVDALGEGGFVIQGAVSEVEGMGDANGDGRPELLLVDPRAGSSPLAIPSSVLSLRPLIPPPTPGAVYVVFGRAATTPVDLAALGPAGRRIDGSVVGPDELSIAAGAGDVNGDGLEDVVAGAPFGNNDCRRSGSAYIIFGATGTATVALGDLGDRGFRMDGPGGLDRTGNSIASAGDLNGDGLGDIVVGAPGGDPDGRKDAGLAFIVYGRKKPPDAPDRTAPRALLHARGGSLIRALRTGRTKVTATVTERATLELTVTAADISRHTGSAGPFPIARASQTLGGAGTHTVSARLTAIGRAVLKASRRILRSRPRWLKRTRAAHGGYPPSPPPPFPEGVPVHAEGRIHDAAGNACRARDSWLDNGYLR